MRHRRLRPEITGGEPTVDPPDHCQITSAWHFGNPHLEIRPALRPGQQPGHRPLRHPAEQRLQRRRRRAQPVAKLAKAQRPQSLRCSQFRLGSMRVQAGRHRDDPRERNGPWPKVGSPYPQRRTKALKLMRIQHEDPFPGSCSICPQAIGRYQRSRC